MKVMHACVEPASTSRAKRSRIQVEAKGSGREKLPDYDWFLELYPAGVLAAICELHVYW